MFYIDDVLFPELLQGEVKTITQPSSHNKKRENESSEDLFTTEMSIFSEDDGGEKLTTKPSNREATTSKLSALLTTRSDVEFIPSDFTEFTSAEDFSAGDFMITPKALPLRSHMPPPKK